MLCDNRQETALQAEEATAQAESIALKAASLEEALVKEEAASARQNRLRSDRAEALSTLQVSTSPGQ